ncbi:MAG TPA: hypothetical protein VMS17_30670 [Gemmataceae bacterium]|nr:hypothetical protein [Gemmataceae bacterium]
MNLHRRLLRLEAEAGARAMADSALADRVAELLAYDGPNPSTLQRRARVIDLLNLARVRRARAEGRA